MLKQRLSPIVLAICLLLGLAGASAAGQPDPALPEAQEPAAIGTSFTFQGSLSNATGPATGACDLRFSLFDAAWSGSQLGPLVVRSGVQLVNGLFAVDLDFGDVFNGDARWLDVAVRCPAGTSGYTTLVPRQAVTAAPYALTARRVLTVDTAAGNFTAHGMLMSSRADPADGGQGGIWLHNGFTNNKWQLTILTGTDELSIGMIDHAGVWYGAATFSQTGSMTLTKDLYINGHLTSDLNARGVLRSARGLPEDSSTGTVELENTLLQNKWHVTNHRDSGNLDFWFYQNGAGWTRPATLDRAGNLQVSGKITQGAIVERNLQTVAEQASASIERFQQGDVLCWDPENQQLTKCAQDASPLVVAVADIDGKPIIMGVEPVRVVGPVSPGDLLVASETPGYAVAWSRDHEGYPPPGVILAKALDTQGSGDGLVKAMILPR
jgi:hypothetical protein